jgi:hypothetical protein
MTDNASSNWRRAFIVYQKYSDGLYLWGKYFTRDSTVTPKRERRITSACKFTEAQITG